MLLEIIGFEMHLHKDNYDLTKKEGGFRVGLASCVKCESSLHV